MGQEGLDFHLYCRDVFHWNLPSNPVDLEQREGRINRWDCLAVRQSIARDWSLARFARELAAPHRNPWEALFARLQADPHTTQRYKHGLYPHWLYECAERENTVGIERHVAFFGGSRDADRYQRLKRNLALYRLVFGQANQEHLLEDLTDRLSQLNEQDRGRAQRRLRGYMLNLSPIGRAEAMRYAHAEAVGLLSSPSSAGLLRLMADVEGIVTKHREELSPVLTLIDMLLGQIRTATDPGERRLHRVRKAVTALAYLRNPYDHFFDDHSVGGFDDDIAVLQGIARTQQRRH